MAGEPIPLGLKSFGLIVYLVEASPKPVSRDVLAKLFWERVELLQGRGSLRQELRLIKRALGQELFDRVLDVGPRMIAVRSGVVRYDMDDVQALLRQDDPDTLRTLLEIRDFGFLSDRLVKPGPFQDWVAVRGLALRQDIVDALLRLSDAALAAGRAALASEGAAQLLTLDPLCEPGIVLAIRCHLAMGQRGEARARFERYRMRILRERGVEPSASLVAMIDGLPRVSAAARRSPAPSLPALSVSPDAKPPVVAVLNVSGPAGPADAYLAEGVVEELVVTLSKSPSLRVSAMVTGPFQGAGVDRCNRDLRLYADYLLRVDVKHNDAVVKVRLTLSRVPGGEIVCSEVVQEEPENLMRLKRRLALSVLSIFRRSEVGPGFSPDPALSDVDTSAEYRQHWHQLMSAHALAWSIRKPNVREARRRLALALKHDPDEPRNLCLMTFTYLLDAWAGWGGDVAGSLREARKWAARAAYVAPEDDWAEVMLGVAYSTHEELHLAHRHMKRAIRLRPHQVLARGELGRIAVFGGDIREGRALANGALTRSPYDQHAGRWVRTLAMAAWMDEDHRAALDLFDYAVTMRPGWFHNHYLRVAILSEMGKQAEAEKTLEEKAHQSPGYSEAALRYAHPFADAAVYRRFMTALKKAGATFTP